MNYLILIDRSFPFGSGEPFLENEIEEISRYFDRVVVFPIDAGASEPMTRKIYASNVDVHAVEKKGFGVRKRLYAVQGLFRCLLSGRLNKRGILDEAFKAAADSLSEHILSFLKRTYHPTGRDKIVLYSYWLYIPARIAANLAEELKNICPVKCISRAHRFDIYEEERGYLPLQKELIERLDAVYPCSNDGTEYLCRKYPSLAKKIVTSYLGTCDHGVNDPRTCPGMHIVSCSRLVPVKRMDRMIDALKLLEGDRLNLSWTHLGGGALYGGLSRRAKKELRFMEVRFSGAISNREVCEFYKSRHADVFVNVSSSEGLPVSIMEAISFGIPVIATDVGGTSEIVENGVSGFLLSEHFRPEELAGRIREMAGSGKEQTALLRKSARRLWERKFRAETNYGAFAEELHRLFSEGDTPRLEAGRGKVLRTEFGR